jgi:hypothetical protein
MTNGFANRFVFFAVRRSKLLPEPPVFDIAALDDEPAKPISSLIDNLEIAKDAGLLSRTAEGSAVWVGLYESLSASQDGLVGSLLARAEAHVLRLSALYALIDGMYQIHPEHLARAMDLWAYSQRSAKWIFGDSLGDPIADTILRALKTNGVMNRTDISNLMGRHAASSRIDAALQSLLARGKVKTWTEPTGGRSFEWWQAL